MKTENNTGNQPIQVTVQQYDGNQPIRIIYREDNPLEHPALIQGREPEPLNIEGIITAPADWIEVRESTIDHYHAHVEVKREEGTIRLVINECNSAGAIECDVLANIGDYNEQLIDEYRTRGTVTGSIQFTDLYRRLHINEEDTWQDPQKLAAFFRLNRSMFPDIEQNMAIVSKLRGIKAKIAADYEKTKDTYTGSRTEFYQQQVEHNLPKSFDINLAIFKGSPKEKYTVEFDVDIVDGKILLQLKSPAINDQVEQARDSIIDAELKRIRDIAPDIVIIEQ